MNEKEPSNIWQKFTCENASFTANMRGEQELGLDGSVGDMLVKLGAQFQPKGVRSYLRTHIGRVPRFDHAKIVDELGLAFRPLEESILETMDDLVKWGHLDPLPSEPTSA